MLPELLEQDHCQQTRLDPATRNHVERRRRLADFLAVAASKLLADMRDHRFPPRRETKDHWLPKKFTENYGDGTITIPGWLAIERGIA